MSVQADCNFRYINIQNLIDTLNCMNTTLLAWWYCGIYKRPGKNDSFRHVPSSSEKVARETALKDSLKKVGTYLT